MKEKNKGKLITKICFESFSSAMRDKKTNKWWKIVKPSDTQLPKWNMWDDQMIEKTFNVSRCEKF